MQKIYSMSYKVKSIPKFEKELKRLAKKYSSLKKISADGTKPERTALGNNCFKIRLAIASKGKGKSGGARVITCVHVIQTSLYLLTIFDKTEQENIPDKELEELLKWISE